MYVRSKSLLTPMLIHDTWNSFVLSLLFYLTSTGVDVEKLLRELSG
jgi:membrane protease YdiL (CAAX protease family)